MTKDFHCIMQIKEGKVINQNPAGYRQFLALLTEGEELIVEFRRKKFEKTNAQLRMAYRLLSAIKDDTGNSIEAIDMWVKSKMGKCYEETIGDDKILRCDSKATFTKEEMEEYINWLLELVRTYEIEIQI